MSSAADVAQRYSERAQEYADALGAIEATSVLDQARIANWASDLPSEKILDLGCGPGHWTNFLTALGHDAVGVDPSEDFVRIAQARFPEIQFEQRSSLELGKRAYVGILAWYSLIHVSPNELAVHFSAIADRLLPGGKLLVGYFTADEVKEFDHAICPAWFYPVDVIERLLEASGLVVISSLQRFDVGKRIHADVIALKPAANRTC
ncbi:TPA: class I SAM-dependent methyltransferase [Corynebacterium striatum]|nr:class I SAM-dependent methyltransferase [Corynebacterium striatum]